VPQHALVVCIWVTRSWLGGVHRAAVSRGLFATGISQLGGVVLDPDKMRSTVQAERVEAHDAPNASQRESLLVFVPADVFAAVREQAAAPAHRRARRRL
jgi:hypothetical protein